MTGGVDSLDKKGSEEYVVTTQDLPQQELVEVHSANAAQAALKEVTHPTKTTLKDKILLWLAKNPKVKKILMWIGIGIMVVLFIVLYWWLNTRSVPKKLKKDQVEPTPRVWEGEYDIY